MSAPLLSILIPTVVGREKQLTNLLEIISKQYKFDNATASENMKIIGMHGKEVQVYYYKDNKEITIGEKRTKLYQIADGVYSWQIDDDDEISDNAIALVLDTIKMNLNVDVVSFEEFIDMDGKIMKSNHTNIYAAWQGDGSKLLSDGFHFHRTIFFKDVIRTELAKSVPIESCRFGEDNLYADALKPFIQSEIHLSEQIYKYIHRSSDHNERYGIK